MRPPISSLLQTTAVSVATVLGTGILGLPVSLHASGLRPFLLTFTLNLLAQLGVVIAAVELLQRAHLAPAANPTGAQPPSPASSYLPTDDVLYADDVDVPIAPLDGHPPEKAPPSLHSLAARFLPNSAMRAVFNVTVVLHFLFILSAYALAGPQAISALVPMLRALPAWVLPTAFVLAGSIAVVCCSHALLPLLTAATAAKAVLLSAVIAVVLARGFVIRQHIVDDWHLRVLVDPFLMGTFALNGVVNLMPVTFQVCLDGAKAQDEVAQPLDVAFVRAYRSATILAIVICYVLNVAWCVAVLLCVPQTDAVVRRVVGTAAVGGVELYERNAVRSVLSRGPASLRQVHSNATLAAASELGQISTLPLIEVLQARGNSMDWVIAFLVNFFIALSITVSFLVMSVGMKHYIDGSAHAQSVVTARFGVAFNRSFKYAVSFSIVLITAVGNPTALLNIMEGVTALSLNMEAGVFVLYMLYVGRRVTKEVPVPLSSIHAKTLIVFVGFYFSSAVLIDAVFFIPNMFS